MVLVLVIWQGSKVTLVNDVNVYLLLDLCWTYLGLFFNVIELGIYLGYVWHVLNESKQTFIVILVHLLLGLRLIFLLSCLA